MGPEEMLVNVTSRQREREEGAAQLLSAESSLGQRREVGGGRACLGKEWAAPTSRACLGEVMAAQVI